MKKTLATFLALLMIGTLLIGATVTAWAAEEANPTDTPAATAKPLMDFTALAPVGAIVILCFLVGEIVGKSPLDNKWIPSVCGVVGGILGVVCLHVMPGYPPDDIVTAAAVGVLSGLAATGADQVYKQLKGV